MNQEALAEKYEISQQRVSQIIAQVRESIPPEDKDKVRQEHLELARTMRAELAKLVDMGPIPAYSNGRPIMIADDDGTRAGGRSLRAPGRDGPATKWIERESKLLGVDAPTKVEASVALSEQDAAQALAAEAAARMAERGNDA
jgi:hypothetical protein